MIAVNRLNSNQQTIKDSIENEIIVENEINSDAEKEFSLLNFESPKRMLFAKNYIFRKSDKKQ